MKCFQTCNILISGSILRQYKGLGENNLSLRHLAASRMEEEMPSVSFTRCLVSAEKVSTDSVALPGASGTAPFVFGAVTFSITTPLESTIKNMEYKIYDFFTPIFCYHIVT